MWNRWCQRSEDTWIRRLMAWRSAAHKSFVKKLSDAAGFNREPSRRRRFGHPTVRRKALQCRAWGVVWYAHAKHDLKDLLDNL